MQVAHLFSNGSPNIAYVCIMLPLQAQMHLPYNHGALLFFLVHAFVQPKKSTHWILHNRLHYHTMHYVLALNNAPPSGVWVTLKPTCSIIWFGPSEHLSVGVRLIPLA